MQPPVPAGADASPVVDADAAGDDDPTQPYVNVDGVDPSVSDPWRLLEPSAGTAAGTVPSEGSNAVPQGGHTPEGESPSNPVGVSRAIKFGGTSIYEFDAESPIGEHVAPDLLPVAGVGFAAASITPSLRRIPGAFPGYDQGGAVFQQPTGIAAETGCRAAALKGVKHCGLRGPGRRVGGGPRARAPSTEVPCAGGGGGTGPRTKHPRSAGQTPPSR